MGRDREGGKKEVKGCEEKRFAGPMSNCFLRPCPSVSHSTKSWKALVEEHTFSLEY